jgi:hypothetical protein
MKGGVPAADSSESSLIEPLRLWAQRARIFRGDDLSMPELKAVTYGGFTRIA